jgi:hypothetical protein
MELSVVFSNMPGPYKIPASSPCVMYARFPLSFSLTQVDYMIEWKNSQEFTEYTFNRAVDPSEEEHDE